MTWICIQCHFGVYSWFFCIKGCSVYYLLNHLTNHILSQLPVVSQQVHHHHGYSEGAQQDVWHRQVGDEHIPWGQHRLGKMSFRFQMSGCLTPLGGMTLPGGRWTHSSGSALPRYKWVLSFRCQDVWHCQVGNEHIPQGQHCLDTSEF